MRRFVTRYFVTLGDSAISWCCKKQPTISQSSAEAKYCALAITACELTWHKSLLASLGSLHHFLMHVFRDNQASLHIASNPTFHEHTKHIEIDCHYVHEQPFACNIVMSPIHIDHQLVDIFTKALIWQ